MKEQIIGNCRLILGDSREVIPCLKMIDAVVTDPPYGIGKLSGGISKKRSKNKYEGSFDDTPQFVKDVCVPIIINCIEIAKRVALTPGVRNLWVYPQPYEMGVFYYPAGAGMSRWGYNCFQPILFYGKDSCAGKLGASNSRRSTEPSDSGIDHPCPKPIGDWAWLVKRASLLNETVLDPFMGSGTTLVACAKLGRKGIGIEIEPKYFDIACKRVEQAYKQHDLFIEQPKPPKQEAFI